MTVAFCAILTIAAGRESTFAEGAGGDVGATSYSNPVEEPAARDVDHSIAPDGRSAAATTAASPESSVEKQPSEAEAPRVGRRTIEEVVVTAQRREQTLREVPISLSVIDEDFVKTENITDFRELARFTPNATINNQGIFEDIRIRGFGSSLTNKSFEQSVGLVIDNAPYGRSPYYLGPMFDVQRVEILRGPQGTLFGKNTTAGLINVTTGAPTDEYTGSISLDYGELHRTRVEPAVGGPIIPGLLNFRLAALVDKRDGTVVNTTAEFKPTLPSRSMGRDRNGVRAKLQFPDLLGADLTLSYEHAEVNIEGAGWEGRYIIPAHANLFRIYDPNYDTKPGNWVGGSSGAVLAGFDGGLGGDFSRYKIDTVAANGHYDIGKWGTDLHASYSNLRYHINSDADFTPSPAFGGFSKDDNPQIVAELRTNSPSLPGLLGLERLLGISLGSSQFTAGFFFQDRRIENSELGFSITPADLAALLVASGATNAGLVTTSPPLPAIFPPIPAGLPIEDVLSTFTALGLQPETSDMFYEQAGKAYAGFANATWNFLPQWSADFGARFTFEQKDATLNRMNSENAILLSTLSFQEFHREFRQSETAFTPRAALRYDWTDEIAFYASYARGFKGGGASEAATNARDEDLLTFDPETADAFELGTKMRLLDGAATFDAALFWQKVKNFQIFTIDQDVSLNVRNAGAMRSRGFEVDSTWLPTDWFTLRGVAGFADAEYQDFKDGTCAFHNLNSDGDADPRCDQSGRTPPRTPPWQTNLVGLARYPLAKLLGERVPTALSPLEILGGFSLEWVDHFFASEALEGEGRQPSYFRVNANLGFGDPTRGWSLRFVGQNLTDQLVVSVVRDVSFAGQSYVQIPQDPRLFYTTFQWAF